MFRFDRPDADVVEVQRGDQVDVVGLLGSTRHVAYVAAGNEDPVRVVRRRHGLWRCDRHRYPPTPCRHLEDVQHALDHLAREDNPTKENR